MRLRNDKNFCIYDYKCAYAMTKMFVYIYDYKCACAMKKMFVYMTTNAPAQRQKYLYM